MMKNSKRKQTQKSPFIIALKGNDFTKAFDLLSKNSFAMSSEYLHNYFRNFKGNYLHDFERQLIKLNAKIYVNAIRNNEVFLDEKHITFLLSDNLLPEDFRIHQKVWRKFHDDEKALWEAIQDEMDKLKEYPLADILIHCVIQLEVMRFEQHGTRENIQHFGAIYNFFIEYLIKVHKAETLQMSTDDFWRLFCKIFKQQFEREENITTKIIHLISSWLKQQSVIHSYCYENYNLTQENDILYLSSTAKYHYKWKLDGSRYHINTFYYWIRGGQFVNHAENEHKYFVRGNDEETKELNRSITVQECAILPILSDLGIDKISFGKGIKNTNVPVYNIFEPLHGYSGNREDRYADGLVRIADRYENWYSAYFKLFCDSIRKDIKNEPYLLHTLEEYKQINEYVIEGRYDNPTDEIIRLFSFKRAQKRKDKKNTIRPFDRHNLEYNVWNRPFIKLGNHIFCPMSFFSCNTWYYSFPQAIMRNDKEETTKMEEDFGERFKEKKGWDVKVIDQRTLDREIRYYGGKGDVDIIVADNETVLFVQLKRTKFRLSQKAAYNEFIMVDKKAARQLNEIEKFFKTEESKNVFDIANRKFVKWIVTTSYENIGKNIDGCKKVNYFDIQHQLFNDEISKLSDLICRVENDEILKRTYKMLFSDDFDIDCSKVLSSMTELPISIFPSEHHRINLDLPVEQNSDILLRELHQKAFELIDLGAYEDSFSYFEKALKIRPNDPETTINYSEALFKIGRNFDGLIKLLELHGMFPLMEFLHEKISTKYDECLKKKLLRPEEFITITDKWNSLN